MNRRLLVMVLMVCLTLSLSVGALGYEPGDHDFGGRTVVFVGHNQTPLSEGSAVWDRLQAAEERYNVKVELRYVDEDDILEHAMAAVLAGDSTYDLIQVSSRDYLPLANQGVLVPLDTIMPDEYWESLPEPHQGREGFKEARMVGGHSYGIPMSFGDYITLTLIAWNPDMFDDAGLPNLYDLIHAGEWTWELAREFGSRLTMDTDGDGVIDRHGFAGMFPTHSMHNTLLPVLATNEVELTRTVDGKTVFSMDEGGKASAIIDIVRQIGFEDRSVRPDAWNFDAFTNGHVGMYFTPLWALENTKNNNFRQGIALMPMGPAASDYTMAVPRLNQMVVPISTNEDPKALVDLWMSIHPPELIDEDVESRMMSAEDGDGFMTLMTAFTDYSLISPFAGILNENNFFNPMQEVIDGDVSAAEGIARITPIIQAAIDDLLNQ